MIWSFVLTAVGLTGFYLAGRKVWWSWYVNLGCQALWIAYAVATEQYGFIVAAGFYSWVFGKNALAWTKEHRDRGRVAAAHHRPLRPARPEVAPRD